MATLVEIRDALRTAALRQAQLLAPTQVNIEGRMIQFPEIDKTITGLLRLERAVVHTQSGVRVLAPVDHP